MRNLGLIKKYSNGVIMDHTFYFYKGLSLIQLNQYDEAEKNLQKSIDFAISHDIDPHYLELFYMGIIHYEKREYEKAIEYFDKSVQQYPEFADSLFYKGEIYYFQHRNELALENLKKSKMSLEKGLTITEDNSFYEDYPYQLKNWMVDNLIEQLEYQQNK